MTVFSRLLHIIITHKKRLFHIVFASIFLVAATFGVARQVQESFFARAAAGDPTLTAQGSASMVSQFSAKYVISYSYTNPGNLVGSWSVGANSGQITGAQGSGISNEYMVYAPSCQSSPFTYTFPDVGYSASLGSITSSGSIPSPGSVTIPACEQPTPTQPPTPTPTSTPTPSTTPPPNTYYNSVTHTVNFNKKYEKCTTATECGKLIDDKFVQPGDYYYSSMVFGGINDGTQYTGRIKGPVVMCDYFNPSEQRLVSSIAPLYNGQPLGSSAIKYGTDGENGCKNGTGFGAAASDPNVNSIMVNLGDVIDASGISVQFMMQALTTNNIKTPVINRAMGTAQPGSPYESSYSYTTAQGVFTTVVTTHYTTITGPTVIASQPLDGVVRSPVYSAYDILYFVMPRTPKDISPQSVNAGEETNITLRPKIFYNANMANPTYDTVPSTIDAINTYNNLVLSQPKTVIVEDTFRNADIFVNGSANIAPTELLYNTPAAGYTTLRWKFDNITRNSDLPKITFKMRTSVFIADQRYNWTFTNYVGNTVSGGGCVSAQGKPIEPPTSANFNIPAGSGFTGVEEYNSCIQAYKTPYNATVSQGIKTQVYDNNNIYYPSDTITYTMQWGPTQQDMIGSKVINILPYNGDGTAVPANNYIARSPGTNLTSGAKAVLTEPPSVSDKDSGIQHTYTLTTPTSINSDPNHTSNQTGGTTKWCTQAQFGTTGCPASFAEVTAFKAESSAGLSSGTFHTVTYKTSYPQAKKGDSISSSFSVRTQSFPLQVNSLTWNNAFAEPIPKPSFTLAKTCSVNGSAPATDCGKVYAGNIISYAITLTNTSAVDATNISVFDDYPQAYLDLNPTSFTITPTTNDGDKLLWANQAVNAGKSIVYTYSATVKSGIPDNQIIKNFATVNTNDPTIPTPPQTETTVTNTTPALTLQKLCSIGTNTPAKDCGTAPVGSTVKYSIIARNTGTAAASNITLTDDYREDLLENIIAPGVSSHDTTTGKLVWSGINLAVGESKEVNYTAVIKTSIADGTSIPNVVTLTDTDPVTPDLTADSVVKAIKALVTVNKTCSVGGGAASSNCGTVRPGQVVSYTVTATNTGSLALTDAVVSDVYSEYVDAPTGFTTNPSGHDTATRTLTWSPVTLNPNEPKVFTYTAVVKTTTPIGTVVINTVTVTSATPGTTLPPPVKSEVGVVNAIPGITKTCKVGSGNESTTCTARPGQTITYTITATNTGDAPVVNGTLTDDWDEVNLNTPTGFNPATPVATNNGSVLTWTGIAIPAKSNFTVSYTAVIKDTVANATPIKNTVVIDDNDPTTTNPTPATSTVTVTNAILSLTKTCQLVGGVASASCGNARPGDTVTYVVKAENTGDAPVVNGTLTDDWDEVNLNTPTGFNPATPVATNNGSVLTWTGIAIPAKSNFTVSYTAVIKNNIKSGTIVRNIVHFDDNDPTTTNPPDVPATFTVANPEFDPNTGLVKTCQIGANPESQSCGDARPGETIHYKITATNSGDANAVNSTLIDTFDATNLENLRNFIIKNPSTSDPQILVPAINGAILTWSNVTIAAKTTVILEFDATVKTSTFNNTQIVNKVQLEPNDPRVPTPPEKTTTTRVVNPILSLTKTCTIDLITAIDCGDVRPGKDVLYTITIANTGLAPITVQVIDNYEKNYLENLRDFTINPLGSTQAAGTFAPASDIGGTLTWNNIELAAMGGGISSRIITYRATTKANTPDTTIIKNSARIVKNDPVVADTPPAEAVYRVINPILSLTKSCTVGTITSNDCGAVRPGDIITYTLLAKNMGHADAKNIDIMDDYDQRYVEYQKGDPKENIDTGTVIVWSNLFIAAQKEITITYTMKVKDTTPNDTKIDNVVTLTDSDPLTINPPPSNATVKNTRPILSIIKTCTVGEVSGVDCGTIKPNQTLHYTITAINEGSADATQVKIEDTYDTASLNNLTFTLQPTSHVLNKIVWDNLTVPAHGKTKITYSATIIETTHEKVIKNVAVLIPPQKEIPPPPTESKVTVFNPKIPDLIRTGAIGTTTTLFVGIILFSLVATVAQQKKAKVKKGLGVTLY